MHAGNVSCRNWIFNVPDDVAEQIRARAARANMPAFRGVADLVESDVGQGWPEDYCDRIAAGAECATLAERAALASTTSSSPVSPPSPPMP
jgi:hypothetical protein